MSGCYYNWNASSGWKFDWPAAVGIPCRRSKTLPTGSKPTAPVDVPWPLGYRRAATYRMCCHEEPHVPRRVMCCCEVPGVRNMCVALRIKVCFGTLSCCREGPGVRRYVGVMSCRTRICVTKSGRNIFPLQECYSNALCTYCILLWRQILCKIYVVYLPSSRIRDNAWYDTKPMINSEYRGSSFWFIKSLH
jgi:hypothetical protein